MSRHNNCRLKWITLRHIAYSTQSPEREKRLVWLKKDDHDENAVENVQSSEERLPDMPLSGSGGRDKSPIDEVTNGVRTVLEDADILRRLSDAIQKDRLVDFLQNDKWEIISTIANGKRNLRDAERIKNLVEDAEKGNTASARTVRRELEKIFRSKPDPAQDKKLERVMQNRELPEDKNKKSRLDMFFERIGELHNPLYTRLADFLHNPIVSNMEVISGQAAFEALRNTEGNGLTRFGLVKKITNENVRSKLGDISPNDEIENRLRALDDLSAFLEYSMYLFSEDEALAVAGMLSYTKGALTALTKTFINFKASETRKKREDNRIYCQKHCAEVEAFLAEGKNIKNETLRGNGKKEGGLLKRLEKASKHSDSGANVFDILQRGIETGGWIDDLPITDGEKYVCSIMALEEMARLFRNGSAPATPQILFMEIRNLFMQAILHKKKGKLSTISDPLSNLKTLQDRVEKAVKNKKSPSFSDVREMRMLRAWLAMDGIDSGISDEKLQIYETASTATTGELEMEAEMRTEKLTRISDISPEEARNVRSLYGRLMENKEEEALYRLDVWKSDDKIGQYLRNNCTYKQLSEVAKMEGHGSVLQWFGSGDFKKNSYGWIVSTLEIKYANLRPAAEQLARQREYAARQEIKNREWRNHESPVLHDTADAKYLASLDAIRKDDKLSDEERLDAIGRLNRWYELDNSARKTIHLMRISEDRDFILNAIQARLRLKARRLKELYLQNMGEEITSNPEKVQNLDMPAFLSSWAVQHFERLEHTDLKNGENELSVAMETIKELKACEKYANDPLGEPEEKTKHLERARKSAKALLASEVVQKDGSEDLKKWLEFYARDDSTIAPAIQKILPMMAMKPELIVNYAIPDGGPEDADGQVCFGISGTATGGGGIGAAKTAGGGSGSGGSGSGGSGSGDSGSGSEGGDSEGQSNDNNDRSGYRSPEANLSARDAARENDEQTRQQAEQMRRDRQENARSAEQSQAEHDRRLLEHPFEEGGDGTDGYEEGSTVARNIRDIENAFVRISAFFDTYPDQANAPSGEDGKTNKQAIKDAEDLFTEKRIAFQSEHDKSRIGELKDTFSAMNNSLQDFLNSISKFDASKRDLSGIKAKPLGLMALLWNVEWMSVNDVVSIVKSIAEDIKRQHQRRQQGRIGRVGVELTSWIGNTPWLKEVPYINTLSSEFQRRFKQAEVDEVENWKKALIDLDSYELQEMARNPSNQDHLKAILNILAERGRIDWSDNDLWRAFNRFSRYTMPIKECDRNENLREDWLRKIIDDIYSDKDHYRNWKTQNDSAIESEKKKHNTEADRLSNLSGGLSEELAKQLRMFERAKAKNQPIPSDVQPHLYEEILDYSIRNGKMSMEDKFYYLVRGIASGLMNRDRLGYLAGEGAGGLLNIFPFIDYFYGKNNTMPEIKALAARLQEAPELPESDAHYKPGIKTRLWLELEVSREPRVQERLRKGIDKKAGEMDHDDMHFFIPRLDWKSIDAMALPQGGGRQKMSNDGWRNAYAGYNSFFKSLGILAKMEEDRVEGAKFSAEDAYQVIKGVAGYVRMDGILTQRSKFDDSGGRRPAIPFGEMKNSYAVVSGGKFTVYESRNKVDMFIRDILLAYDFSDEFIEKLLLDMEAKPNRSEHEQIMAKESSKVLQHNLELAVNQKGVGIMKNILKKHMNYFVESDPGGYNYENAKRMYIESMQSKQEFAQLTSQAA